jgi:hypothetical protein
MGRTDGHQWGDSVAAYGEVFMATVTVVPPSVGAGGLLVNGSFLIATYLDHAVTLELRRLQ